MSSEELTLLRLLRFGDPSLERLEEIHARYRTNYQVQFQLVQHPRFPENLALNIVPGLRSMDLLRMIKNRRTNPFIRKKAEIEFMQRYSKFPPGEKRSYIKVAPPEILRQLTEETQPRILAALLANTQCTEDLVLRLLNRKGERYPFYQALQDSDWIRRPRIASAIILDRQAPIRLLLKLLPVLNRRQLLDLAQNPQTHDVVKEKIGHRLKRLRQES